MHWSKLYARQLRDTEIIPSSQTYLLHGRNIRQSVKPCTPTPQAWQETQKYSCLLGDLQLSASTISLLYFFKKQYHHYHSPKFKICYITRNEETGIHTDLHQLLQDCTAWSRWYRDWRPQASRPKPFVFMATFSYIVYKEIYEKLEFTGHGRGIRTPECTLSCENHHRWTPYKNKLKIQISRGSHPTSHGEVTNSSTDIPIKQHADL